MKRIFIITLFVLAALLPACEPASIELQDVAPAKVMIFLSNGHNSLSTYLSNDIREMKAKGYVPAKNSPDYLLIISTTGAAGLPATPVLTRLYRNAEGLVVADTVYRRDNGTVLADAAVLKDFLDQIHSRYPSPSYGMVVSSHATGWLPSGYYANPSKLDPDHKKTGSSDDIIWTSAGGAVRAASGPLRTITSEGPSSNAREIELADFVAAIPMHLDYMLIDACLCGVETACQFRGVADLFGCSLTEVMADGFDYESIAHHLLEKATPDPAAVCKAFIDYYSTASFPYASIALYRTDKIPALADACRPLFEKYRTALCSTLDWSVVQPYFGGDRHWFFDLLHALECAGATPEELASVNEAISQTLVYSGTTGKYYSATDSQTHTISHFSGICMYLPCAGTSFLNTRYRLLDWNSLSGLVE